MFDMLVDTIMLLGGGTGGQLSRAGIALGEQLPT